MQPRLATLAQNGWDENQNCFEPLNLPLLGQRFVKTIEKQNYILFYVYSLGGMVLTGASTSDCAHRGLAVNAPDWGLAHMFFGGDCRPGD